MTTTPENVDRLTGAVDGLARRLRVARRVTVGLAVSVALDLVLSAFLISQHFDQNAINDRQNCTDHQRQFLTALSRQDQLANRRLYTDIGNGALQTADGFVAALNTLVGTWDHDALVRDRVVANKGTVTETVITEPMTKANPSGSPRTFTVKPCR